MIETIVRKLSDGEELVLEIPHEDLEDPRERTMETRRLAVGHDDGTPNGSRS
jgi:hypothetical protein